MKTAAPTLTLCLALAAGSASSQVVINEVYENAPGPAAGNDSVLEFIEFYGEPGMSLDGFAIGQFKGGEDPDGDDFPNTPAEIDEAFSLTGFSLDSNGLFVLYNGTPDNSLIPLFLPVGANSGSFFDAHIPTSDTNGNLNNDGSSTYLLVRARPGYSLVDGVDTYGSEYNMAKETNPDVDFDGGLDFGNEMPLIFAPSPQTVQPLQIIDELAWSNNGGKEYVSDSEFEISDTPGFNPDAVSRLAYFVENPEAGVRLNSDEETVPTRIADEELIYGSIATTFDYDTVEVGAPTDPTGDGFQDLDVSGFALTPGALNDGAGLTQFRFVRGDFDFDLDVDADDQSLIVSRLGEDLDVTAPCIDDDGNPILVDGVQPDCFVYQGRDANAVLAMTNMDKTDGPGGTNDPAVTQADLDAFDAEFGPFGCNVADLVAPFGITDLDDADAFIVAFLAGDAAADLVIPFGIVDLDDVDTFINAFLAGCP